MLTLPVVRALDPTDDLLDALHDALCRGWAVDHPHEPPPTRRHVGAAVRTPFSGDPAALLVEADGRGWALVELPSHDNLHVALADLYVDPAFRRQGVGAALLAAVLDLARSQGRRSVLWEAGVGSALDAFASALGAVPELEEVQRQQRIGALDLGPVARLRAAAEQRAVGYRLEAWAAPCPPRLRPALAAATHALNDAPMGGLDYDGEVWDADRVTARESAVAAAGLRMHTVLALSPHDEAVGFTDVLVTEAGTHAWQWGTAVAAAHRGHRLGMLLKTTMVERLRALEPALEVVATWNADSNVHMIAVNDALGYRPVARTREWQVRIG